MSKFLKNTKKESNMISHSPMKKVKERKKKTGSMFSPTGGRKNSNTKKKKKPKVANKQGLTPKQLSVKKYSEKDVYTFNFKRLLEVEYDPMEFDPYCFIAKLPPHKPITRNFCIPKKRENSKKISLVLDLDETLVHCGTVGMKNYDLIFPVVFNSVEYKVFVRKRPFFEEFLDFCSKNFEVIVFTASHKSYASKLLDLVDKKKKHIIHRVYRDSCVIHDGNYLKDLTVLGRDLRRVVIVDNSPTAFGYQLENGIPIVSWYEDMNDKDLIKLIPFLKKLSVAGDVRPLIKEKFKFHKIITEYKKKL